MSLLNAMLKEMGDELINADVRPQGAVAARCARSTRAESILIVSMRNLLFSRDRRKR